LSADTAGVSGSVVTLSALPRRTWRVSCSVGQDWGETATAGAASPEGSAQVFAGFAGSGSLAAGGEEGGGEGGGEGEGACG